MKLNCFKKNLAIFFLENDLEWLYLVLKKLEYVFLTNAPKIRKQRHQNCRLATSSPFRLLKKIEGKSEKSVLFVTYHSAGLLSDHVKHYIQSFKNGGYFVVLIKVVDDLSHFQADALIPGIDAAMVRKNEGYDFGAWSHALHVFPELYKNNVLIFANDSLFGPLSTIPFRNLLDRIEKTDADLIGLTQCYPGNHFQSFFFVFKNVSLNAKAIRTYWENILNLKNKDDVVFKYEFKLKQYFFEKHFRCEVLFPQIHGVVNPTIGGWKQLIELGFPFIKVALLNPERGIIHKFKCYDYIKALGYDVALIDQHITSLNAKDSTTSY